MSTHSLWLLDHLPPGEGDDSPALVRAILDGLSAARTVPDALAEARPFAGALKRALSRKVRVDDAAWCELVRILYDLATRPLGAEAPLADQTRYISLCSRLLAKRSAADAARGGGLELAWRPLFDALQRWHFSPRQRPFSERILAQSTVRKHGAALGSLAVAAREHFGAGCAPQIIGAVQPMLCPLAPSFGFGSYALALLVPSGARLAGSAEPFVRAVCSVSGHVDSSSELLRNCFDSLSRVAKSAFVGRVERIEWAEHAPMLYTRTLSALGVAAVLDESAMSLLQAQSELVPAEVGVLSSAFPILSLTKRAARLLVLALDGAAPAGEALARLQQLIRAVETFCHPSNDGWWVVRLGHLLLCLAKSFDWRICHERACAARGRPTVYAPLREEHADALLDALLPLTLNGVHSKNGMMRAFARKAVHHLTRVRPCRVAVCLADHSLSALTTETAVHQAESMLHVLARLAPELVCPRAPAAAQPDAGWPFPDERVGGLLELLLPAIGASTGGKAKAALFLAHALLVAMPVASAEWADERGARPPPGLALADAAALAASAPPADSEEAEARARALADGLPVWALALLERLLLSAEAAQDEDVSAVGGAGGGEKAMGLPIVHAFDPTQVGVLLAFQASEAVAGRLLSRVAAFCEGSILPQAGHAELAPIVGGLARAAPAQTLGALLPLALDRLVERAPAPKRAREVAAAEGGGGGGAAQPAARAAGGALAPQSRRSLAHWLSVATMSLVGTGEALLAHVPALAQLFALTRSHEHAEVASLSGHALHTALHALCATYLTEERSVAPALWHAREFRAAHWRHWGAVAQVADPDADPDAHAAEALCARTPLAARWHAPTDAEVRAAAALANDALDFAEAELRACGVLPGGGEAGAPAAGAAGASVDQRARCALLQVQAVIGGLAAVAAEAPMASAADEAEAAAMDLETSAGAEADGEGEGEMDEADEAAAPPPPVGLAAAAAGEAPGGAAPAGAAAGGGGGGAYWRELRARLPRPAASQLAQPEAIAVRVRVRALVLAVAERLAPPSPLLARAADTEASGGGADGGAAPADGARPAGAGGREGGARLDTFVRTALVLARCLGALLTDRGGSVLARVDKLQKTMRQRAELRGAGRQRARPRFVALQRLKALHNRLLHDASYQRAGGGGHLQRSLLAALFRLSCHVSPEVRAAALRHASDGAKRCARSVVVAQLRLAIDALGDAPAAPAGGGSRAGGRAVPLPKHEVEGAIAVLSQRSFSALVGSDWALLAPLLCALHKPREHAPADADALRLELRELLAVYARLPQLAPAPERGHPRLSRRQGAEAHAAAHAALLRAAVAAQAGGGAGGRELPLAEEAAADSASLQNGGGGGGGGGGGVVAAARAQTAMFGLALTLSSRDADQPSAPGAAGEAEEGAARAAHSGAARAEGKGEADAEQLQLCLLRALASPIKACRTGAAASLCRLLTRDAPDADTPPPADEGERLRAALPPGPLPPGALLQPPPAALSRAALSSEAWGCWLRADASCVPPPPRARARLALAPPCAALLRSSGFLARALSWQAADHRDSTDAPSGVDAMMDRLSHGALDALTDLLSASPHALGLELSAAAAGALGSELSPLNVALWHALCCAHGGERLACDHLLPAVSRLLQPEAAPGAPAAAPARDRQLVAAEAFVAVGLACSRWEGEAGAAACAQAEASLGRVLSTALGASTECAAEWAQAVEVVCADAHPLRAQWLAALALEHALRLSAPTPLGAGAAAAAAGSALAAAAGAAAAGADAGGTAASSVALATWLRVLAKASKGSGWRASALFAHLSARPQLRTWLVHPAKLVRTRAAHLLARALQLAALPPPSAVGAPAEVREGADAAVRSLLAAADAAATVAAGGADAAPLGPPAGGVGIGGGGGGGGGGVGGVGEESAADRFHDALVQLVLVVPVVCASMLPLTPHAPELLSAVVRAATSARAPELRNSCKVAALALSHLPLSAEPHERALLFERIGQIARRESEWRARGAMAALLGPLLLRLQFALGEAELGGASATVLALLVDPQQEVREACLPLVSGLARIAASERRAELQLQLCALAGTPLASSRLEAEHASRLAQRHGGVLGLAALVRSSPYAVPPWLPPVLDLLSQHAQDPFPLCKEVQATVAEFKRTHQDNWEECRAAFSEEQLSRILDSSSALAHYA